METSPNIARLVLTGTNFAPSGSHGLIWLGEDSADLPTRASPSTDLLCMFADESITGLRDGSTSADSFNAIAANSQTAFWPCARPAITGSASYVAAASLLEQQQQSGGGTTHCHASSAYRSIAPAHFYTHNRIECEIPPCLDTSPCLGTLRVRVTHGGDAAAEWSTQSLPFTYYRYRVPPTLEYVVPEIIDGIGSYADLRSPHVLDLHGSNFAPTSGSLLAPVTDTVARLRCRFSGQDGEQTRATFVHAHLIRCSTPYVDPNVTAEALSEQALLRTVYSGIQPVIGTSVVSASNHARDNTLLNIGDGDGGQAGNNGTANATDSAEPALSDAELAASGWSNVFNITFYDGQQPPTIGRSGILESEFVPISGKDPTVENPITIEAINIAPLSPSELQCVHRGTGVPATWLSDSLLKCRLPPVPLGSFDVVGVLSHGLVGNSTLKFTSFDQALSPEVSS